MKRVVYFLLFAAIFLYPLMGTAAAPSRKPLGPMRITIAPVSAAIMSEDQIKPGDVIEFRVTAVSSIDVPDMDINIELLGGAKLVSGETSWSGPGAKNEEKTILISVQWPEQGQARIKASVSIPPSDSTRFSAVTEYPPVKNKKLKPEQEQPVKKDSKGRDVIEYR